MGATQSDNNVVERSLPRTSERSLSSGARSSWFGDFGDKAVVEDFSENPISEDVLIEILSYVPAKDLIFSCRLVTKRWRSIIDAQSIWRVKCERENVKLPTRKLTQLPNHHYRYVYFHSISKRKNLVKNPCGEKKFKNWKILAAGGDGGFAIENPPAGSDPVPAEVGSQRCFATSFAKCAKYQKVNLAENTINNYLLRHDLVKIKVGEWYAARFDCACEYELKVVLNDDLHRIIDQFEFRFIEEQWIGRQWHLVTHEFDNVTDAYSISFHHQGKDRQFWAGHYGSKMTGAFVELCIK